MPARMNASADELMLIRVAQVLSWIVLCSFQNINYRVDTQFVLITGGLGTDTTRQNINFNIVAQSPVITNAAPNQPVQVRSRPWQLSFGLILRGSLLLHTPLQHGHSSGLRCRARHHKPGVFGCNSCVVPAMRVLLAVAGSPDGDNRPISHAHPVGHQERAHPHSQVRPHFRQVHQRQRGALRVRPPFPLIPPLALPCSLVRASSCTAA